jgi:RNA polymerase sigma-54 factor
MRLDLRLGVRQSVALAPQLQRTLRLLQLPALEFAQEIAAATAQNPFLELDEEDSTALQRDADWAVPEPTCADEGVDLFEAHAAYDETDGGAAAAVRRTAFHDDDGDLGAYVAAPVTLYDHLLEQVGASALGDRDRLLAAAVVAALDADG